MTDLDFLKDIWDQEEITYIIQYYELDNIDAWYEVRSVYSTMYFDKEEHFVFGETFLSQNMSPKSRFILSKHYYEEKYATY